MNRQERFTMHVRDPFPVIALFCWVCKKPVMLKDTSVEGTLKLDELDGAMKIHEGECLVLSGVEE